MWCSIFHLVDQEFHRAYRLSGVRKSQFVTVTNPPDMGLQRKRPRIECNAEELPWKKIRRPFETGLGGDDGILELEEVEGVEVIYTTTDEGKVAKFCVSSPFADSHDQPFDRATGRSLKKKAQCKRCQNQEALRMISKRLILWRQ